MNLLAVNLAAPKRIEYRGRQVWTGIFKHPVQWRVMARKLGLDGDGQADLEAHGGIDKAIYAYTIENYCYWQAELNRPEMSYGQFGENLTVDNMPDDEVCIGDIFRIGEALVQVTQPRVPCFKLGIKMESQDFPRRFLPSGRVGFYLRVLEEGTVGADDDIARIRQDPCRMSILEAMRALVKAPGQCEVIQKLLNVEALSDAWRNDLRNRAQALEHRLV